MAVVSPQAIFDYLDSWGVSAASAAGILANIQAESGFDSAITGDNETSGGLFQHHDTKPGQGRWTNLKRFAAAQGVPWTDWRVQVDFALQEARQMGLNLQQADPSRAASEWTVRFERPADAERKAEDRARNANQFLFAQSTEPMQLAQPVQFTQPSNVPRVPSLGVPSLGGDVTFRDPDLEVGPIDDVLTQVFDRLSHFIAGGRRQDPRDLLPEVQDPSEGVVPEEVRPDVETFDWFDPAIWARATPENITDADIQRVTPATGEGREGTGGDWFRGGEAPNNFVNRHNPLYQARREFAVTIHDDIENLFDVSAQGSAGYLRPPDPSHAAPGGASPNSDHYSGGAIDFFGETENLQRLRDWLVTQPFVSFVRWQSESHFDHVHVSFDLGWIAENWFQGRTAPILGEGSGSSAGEAPGLPEEEEVRLPSEAVV